MALIWRARAGRRSGPPWIVAASWAFYFGDLQGAAIHVTAIGRPALTPLSVSETPPLLRACIRKAQNISLALDGSGAFGLELFSP